MLNCHNPKRLKRLTRLRVALSHFCEQEFKHRFHDLVNTFLNCRNDKIKTSGCFLLRCYNFSNERLTLRGSIRNIRATIFQLNNANITHS